MTMDLGASSRRWLLGPVVDDGFWRGRLQLPAPRFWKVRLGSGSGEVHETHELIFTYFISVGVAHSFNGGTSIAMFARDVSYQESASVAEDTEDEGKAR